MTLLKSNQVKKQSFCPFMYQDPRDLQNSIVAEANIPEAVRLLPRKPYSCLLQSRCALY